MIEWNHQRWLGLFMQWFSWCCPFVQASTFVNNLFLNTVIYTYPEPNQNIACLTNLNHAINCVCIWYDNFLKKYFTTAYAYYPLLYFRFLIQFRHEISCFFTISNNVSDLQKRYFFRTCILLGGKQTLFFSKRKNLIQYHDMIKELAF